MCYHINMKANVAYVVLIISFFAIFYFLFIFIDPIINGPHDYGTLSDKAIEIKSRLHVIDIKNEQIDPNTRRLIEKYNEKILKYRHIQEKTPSFWQKDWYSLPVFVLNKQKTHVILVDYKGKLGGKFSSF